MNELNLSLKELFAGLEILAYPPQWPELQEAVPAKLCIDSRKLGRGDIFIAVPGFEHDGHAYLSAAAAAGALLAVVEKPQTELDLPQIQVANSRSTQADLADRYYGHPSGQLKLCGITGSNGKTTTSLMYRRILEQAGHACGLIGTVSYEAGEEQLESHMTTPDSIDLQKYLYSMTQNKLEYAVMEVSSIGISQYRPKNTDFDVLAFINLGREHLDYHGSMEAYFAEKCKVMRSLRPEALAVLNYDDDYVKSLIPDLNSRILSFGLSPQADIYAANLDLSTGFAHFDLCIRESCSELLADSAASRTLDLAPGRYSLALKVPGFHSVYNALAAIAAALGMGIGLTDCLNGIRQYRGVERRFQEIYDGKFRIFDDHFANGKNIEMTLETLSAMDYENLVLLYAIRGKRGVTVNRENIETLAGFLPRLRVKNFIASRSQDVVGHYDEVQPAEEAAFAEEMAKAGQDYEIFDCLEDAVEQALAEVSDGDILLLAGCQGMDAGARIALQRLAERYPAQNQEILAVLKDRVCGW